MASGPLVFQCVQCRTIVGDSLRTVGAFEALNALAVEVCTGVTTAPALIADAERSAYRWLHCAHCAACLGKAYVRAPPHLQALVGAITFDVDSLQSYPLGDASETAASLPVVAAGVRSIGGAAGSGAAGDSSVVPNAEEELREELLKVQTIILSLNERVMAIEARHAEEDEDSAPASARNGAAAAVKRRKS
jgi:hypothetical protein